MDIALLRTCLAVYRTGSITKAARALGISQPAVTGHLRALEAKLDQRLFHRMPNGTVPTKAGHELVRDTADALDRLEAALSRRLEPEHLSDRMIRLAGPAEVISARVLPAIGDLLSAGLPLQVSLGLTDQLVEELAEGLHDLVITTRQPRHRGLESAPLMDEEFALVGAPEWARRLPAAAIGARGAEALLDAPVLSYSHNLPIIRRYWLSVFGQRPTLTARVTVPDLRGVLAAVRAGAGISVLPTYLCGDDIAGGALAVLYEPEVPPLNTLFLATRSGALASDCVGLTTLRSHLLRKATHWE